MVWSILQYIFNIRANVHIHHVTRAEKKKACREERGLSLRIQPSLLAAGQRTPSFLNGAGLVIWPFPGFKVVFWISAIFCRLKKVNTRSMFLFQLFSLSKLCDSFEGCNRWKKSSYLNDHNADHMSATLKMIKSLNHVMIRSRMTLHQVFKHMLYFEYKLQMKILH